MAYKVNLHDPDGCCVDHSDCGDGGVLGSEKINDFRVSAVFSLFGPSSAAQVQRICNASHEFNKTAWLVLRE